MGCHAMDQRRGEVDIKDRDEEDHVDCQPNHKEGDHPHFGCQSHTEEQLRVYLRTNRVDLIHLEVKRGD